MYQFPANINMCLKREKWSVR